jgi:hypothetical protein
MLLTILHDKNFKLKVIDSDISSSSWICWFIPIFYISDIRGMFDRPSISVFKDMFAIYIFIINECSYNPSINNRRYLIQCTRCLSGRTFIQVRSWAKYLKSLKIPSIQGHQAKIEHECNKMKNKRYHTVLAVLSLIEQPWNQSKNKFDIQSTYIHERHVDCSLSWLDTST